MKRNIFTAAVLLLGVTVLAGPHWAMAANNYTSACTQISNQASVSYSVGGVSQTGVNSNTNQFYVGAKINMTVAETDAAPGVTVAPGATGQLLTFTIRNDGNIPQVYDLSAQALASSTGLTYPAAETTGFVVTSPTTSFGGGSATKTSVVNPDSSVTVQVYSSIPSGAGDLQIGGVGLLATARFYDDTAITAGGGQTVKVNGTTSCTADVVFADGADGVVSGDAARDAVGSTTNAYVVNTATLTVAKSSSATFDPVDCNTGSPYTCPGGATGTARAIPGAVVTYQVQISNAGSAAATSVGITDDLSSFLASTPAYATWGCNIGGSLLPYQDGSYTCTTNGDYAVVIDSSGNVTCLPSGNAAAGHTAGAGYSSTWGSNKLTVSGLTVPKTTGTATVKYQVTIN